MKIFNPLYNLINDITPKVIEVGKGFLLNTQYYLKSNLSPVPFESVFIYGSPLHLNLNKSLYCDTYSWNRKNIENTIIADDLIPNRYYVFVHSGYERGTRRMNICVMDETDSTCTLVKDVINEGDCQFLSYIDQNEQYLYYTTLSNKTWYLVRYDKLLHTYSNTFSLGYTYSQPNPTLIYKDAAFYFFVSYSDNNIVITRYDIANNTAVSAATYRGQMTTTGNYNCSQMLQPVQLSATEYGAYAYNLGNPAQPLGIYSVDVTNPNFNTTYATACRYTPCTITWSSAVTELRYNTANHSTNTYYRMFEKQVGNDTYFIVAVHNSNFENVSHIPYQGVYVFLKDNDTSFTFVNYDNIDTSRQINGYIFSDNTDAMIVAFKRGFKIYKFDNTELKYVDTGVEFASIYDVGLDEAGRLWYVRLDGSVHLANLSDAQEVDIKFAQNYYEYTGSDISTHVTFRANTYLGEEASGSFNLQIEGPAHFTENGRREIVINYSGVMDIPITITGAAPVTIYPKYLV